VLKTAAAITCIMLLGRVMLRPLYRAIASTQNAEIFAATTLLTCLGTSLLTESLGLSAALGAFLAGLLLAETEFHLQVSPMPHRSRHGVERHNSGLHAEKSVEIGIELEAAVGRWESHSALAHPHTLQHTLRAQKYHRPRQGRGEKSADLERL